MLTVAMLGPVELRRDGEPLAVPAGKTSELLIRLALEAGVHVRTDRLIDELWSAQVTGVARNTVQAKVSKLRRVLGDADLLTGDRSGYTLHIDPARVDALEVLRVAEAGFGSAGAESVRRATTEALVAFRGELPPFDWFAPYRLRLDEARLRLTEDNLGARLALGADVELVGELEALVTAHPWREELWRLLITALYRADRQADALAAYARVRRILADDLGIDPGPGLQTLETRILRQDAALAPPRGNIPVRSASLVGRAADVSALTALVRAEPLVTVVGPAGVGKTRLALEVARTFPAAWLVRLDDATAIWPDIGATFGLAEATEHMVVDRLRGLDAVLVLDNCEPVVEALPAVLDRINGPRILATSQVPLGADGERTYPLSPLSLPDSVTLFTERAVVQRRSFSATHAQLAEVCRSLDGLPLAIELAAARAKALSIEEISRRLDDRFTFLTDPAGRRPPRQRTLRAAIGWSYDLLFPDDQQGLQALSCFAGGASLAAAEEVLAALGVPPPTGVDVLTRLVDRSLSTVDVGAGGAVRYRLLDSVREFGRERLRASRQEDRALAAHAAWFAAAAGEAAAGLRGADQPRHLSLVRTERADIDAALAWSCGSDPLLGLRMANGFGWAWVFLGAGSDAARRFRIALAAAPDAPVPDRVDAMLFAGWFEASGGDLDRSVREIRDAIDLAEDKAHPRLFLAFAHSQQGRPHDALAALAACRDDLRGWERGAAWLLTAWATIALGDVAEAKRACAEALAVLSPLGDQWALSHAEAMLGTLAQAERRFPDAVAHLTRAADAAHRLGFAAAGSLHRTNLGRAHQQNGDPTAAIAAFERAIQDATAAGDLRVVALARVRLARVLRALGRTADARSHVDSARQWYATAGGGDGALLADHLDADLDADPERLATVLAAARAAGDPEVEVLTLDALARLHAAAGRTDEAAAARAAADDLMPAAGHLLTPDDRRPSPP
ncbi:MAG TPA: BTAD domain-containing putative transcriptional regulator [Actinoplanes sp.]